MELQGTIKFIGQTEQVSQSFSKRDIVLITEESSQYPQPISIQFTQAKCDDLNIFQPGQKVKISINLRGKEYQDKQTGVMKYFNTIQGWKIESLQQQPSQPNYGQQQPPQQQQGYGQPNYNNNGQGNFNNGNNGNNQQQNNNFPPAPNFNNNDLTF